MEKNLEHYADRLEKDSYSKDDVAKLLQNEAAFSAQQTKKDYSGMVSREDFDTVSSELASVREELTPYKTADFDKLASSEFEKLNGNQDRFSDFKTLAKLSGSESSEDILAKATELKTSGNYGFMFKVEDSGGAKNIVNTETEPKTSKKGAITPKIGSFNFFKRK